MRIGFRSFSALLSALGCSSSSGGGEAAPDGGGTAPGIADAGGKVQLKNKIESCPVCGGTGYLGQTGVFEVLIVDDEARRYLSAGDLKGALSHARRNKMIYFQEAALSKVISGETSIEEVIRVTSPARKNTSGSSSRAPTPQVDPAAAT